MKKLLYTICIIFIACNSNKKSETDLSLIPVKSGQYWGYVNHDGKIIINPQFANAQPFYEGLALVKSSDGKFGYINEEGKFIINPIYKEATNFGNGLALVVKENSKLEFINVKGETKILLDPAIEKAHKFSEGLALVNMSNQYGYINDEGKISIPSTFAEAEDFSEGLAKVAQYDSIKNELKYGFINKNGELIINYQFKAVSNFKEGLALVNNGTQSGYIDKYGKFLINPQFDNVSHFVGDYAALKQGELWGFIDKKGKIIINPQFKSVDLFYDNGIAAVVSTNGKTGFIDKEGKYVINPQFDHATRFYNDMSIINLGGKFGLIDKKGKITMNPQFEAINTGSIENYWVYSDYFDVSDVVSYIIESITDRSFNGLSAQTKFKDLQVLYPNLNENNYSNFNSFVAKENRYIGLTIIGTEYVGGLTISTPQYETQQVYDPTEGGYINQQIYTGSTSSTNPNATLMSIKFVYTLKGKAVNKKIEIVNVLNNRINALGSKEMTISIQTFSDVNLLLDIQFNTSSNNSPVADSKVVVH